MFQYDELLQIIKENIQYLIFIQHFFKGSFWLITHVKFTVTKKQKNSLNTIHSPFHIFTCLAFKWKWYADRRIIPVALLSLFGSVYPADRQPKGGLWVMARHLSSETSC